MRQRSQSTIDWGQRCERQCGCTHACTRVKYFCACIYLHLHSVLVRSAVGVGFDSQFVLIFPDLLSLYTLYGQHFVNLVAKGFAEKLRHAIPKEMRSTRRAGLRLIETFVQRAAPDSLQVRTIIVEQVLPPLLAVIAVDFRSVVHAYALPSHQRETQSRNLYTQTRSDPTRLIAPVCRDSLPELRDAEVLTLSTTLVKKLNAEILLVRPAFL